MAGEDRNFDPLANRLILDRDQDDTTLQRVDPDLPSWPQISRENQNALVQTERLDGLVVVSETMAIAKNNGVIRFASFPPVIDRHLDRYKGLREFFGQNTRHLYEFCLSSLGSSVSLCAIIATDTVVRADERPVFYKMTQEYLNIIRLCIGKLSASRMSRQHNLLATNTPISIFQEDWKNICDQLILELPIAAARLTGQNIFPRNPRFYWCTKDLGQSLYIPRLSENFRLGVYDFIIDLNINKKYGVAVHCALDSELESNVLFFNPNQVAKSHNNLKPADLYFVGLIPGIANMTYANINREHFSYAQYYTKFWSGCHRDSKNIFMTNGVARDLYQRYVTKLGTSKPGKLRPRDKFINDEDRKLTKLFEGLRACCGVTTPARVEVVWSILIENDSTQKIDQVIGKAFTEFRKVLRQEKNPLFCSRMLVAIPCQNLSERLLHWLDVIEKSVASISKAVQEIESEENLWLMNPTKIIPVVSFCCCQVAEFILHLLLRGKPHKSYPWHLQNYLGLDQQFLADYDNFEDFWSSPWPFQDVSVRDSMIVADHPEELKDELALITGLELDGNKFISFAETRKNFFDAPQNNQSLRVDPQVFRNLAKELLDVFIYIQKKQTSSAKWGEVSLKMLMLERIDFSRKLVHMNVDEFIIHLMTTQNHKMPMSPQTKIATDIISSLRSNIARFSAFRKEFETVITERITNECCPLRFTFGKLHEIYIYSDFDIFPPTDEMLKVFNMGLLHANGNRVNQCKVALPQLVQTVKNWLKLNACGKTSEVALAVQDIFDHNRIRLKRDVPTALRSTLITLIDGLEENGENDSDETDLFSPPPSSLNAMSVSESDIPLALRKHQHTTVNLRQTPGPSRLQQPSGNFRPPGSRNKTKTRKPEKITIKKPRMPSKTRRQNVSRAMYKYWANKKKQQNSGEQESDNENSDENNWNDASSNDSE